MKVKWRTLDSSNLAGVAYMAKTKTLIVRFVNDTVYVYSGVSMGEYRKLLNAPSKGGYFNAWIKNHYSWEQLEYGYNDLPDADLTALLEQSIENLKERKNKREQQI